MQKTYVGLIRDHSGSMYSHRNNAIKDYNSTIAGIRENSIKYNLDNIVSVLECAGVKPRAVVTFSSIHALKEITSYEANGGTPLFESVGFLIESFKLVPDYNDPNVAFLIQAVTDGHDNQSPVWEHKLGDEIKKLQGTDRWTFTFRVPAGYKNDLVRYKNIPAGNVMEWEQTDQGFREAEEVTAAALSNYYSARSMGQTATQKFYTNVDTAKMNRDVTKLDNISKSVKTHVVARQAKIKDFVENELRATYIPGTLFYELRKTEKVQPQKGLLIVDRKSNAVYAGYQARELLGLPRNQHIKVSPGYHGSYDIYIQSTSVNRILYPGQKVVHWPNKV